MVDWQSAFNILLAGSSGALGFLLKTAWTRQEKFREDFDNFRVEVATTYARVSSLDRIMEKLERIEALLHTKADRE